MVRNARLIFVICILVATLGTATSQWRPAADAATTFPMRTADTLLGGPRGGASTVIAFAERYGASRIADTRAYISEIFRLAPQVGLDPAIMIAQSALETNYWRTGYWSNNLNPGGIGIYYSGAPSFTWRSGTDAARGHIYHLYVFAAGVPRSTHPLYAYRHLTPGTDGIVSGGYAGTTHTIAQLTGRWAVDPSYHTKLVAKGNEIFIGPPGAPTPTKSPTPAATIPPKPIAGSTASDGNDPRRAYDGNLSTTWTILGNGVAPSGGSVTFDLGSTTTLTSIRWVFRLTGYADHLRIRTSTDGVNFTTILFTGNAPAKVWQSLATSTTPRYVRFHFLNPNSDPDLGYLAEVAFVGSGAARIVSLTPTVATGTPTATVAPSPTATQAASIPPQPVLDGTPLTPIGSGGSSGVNPTVGMRDGNLATDWRTTAVPPPSSAFVYLDLGGRATITGARWYLREANCGASLSIAGSDDKRLWTTYAVGTTAYRDAWLSAAFIATQRYIRFQFLTPAGSSALGCLAEAEVLGLGVTAAEPTPPTPTSDATATVTVTPTPTSPSTPATSPTSVPTAPTQPAVPIETATAAPTFTPIPIAPTETVPSEPTPTDTPTTDHTGIQVTVPAQLPTTEASEDDQDTSGA